MKQLRLTVLGLCGAVLLTFGGCGRAQKRTDPQKELLQYMNERYPDDHFTWEANQLRPQDSASGSFAIFAHRENFPDAEIRVSRRLSEDGTPVYGDNYMVYYLQADIEAYIHDIAEEFFGECKVFMSTKTILYISEKMPTDTTAEGYLEHLHGAFGFYLPPDGLTMEAAKEKLEKFRDALKERNFSEVSGGIYIVTDANAYENAIRMKDRTEVYMSTNTLNL